MENSLRSTQAPEISLDSFHGYEESFQKGLSILEGHIPETYYVESFHARTELGYPRSSSDPRIQPPRSRLRELSLRSPASPGISSFPWCMLSRGVSQKSFTSAPRNSKTPFVAISTRDVPQYRTTSIKAINSSMRRWKSPELPLLGVSCGRTNAIATSTYCSSEGPRMASAF